MWQVARVGPTPGVTRGMDAFRVGDDPPLYMVDTPGVMVPRIDCASVGLRLALTAAVPDAVGTPGTAARGRRQCM